MSEIIFKFSEDVKEFLREPLGIVYKNIEDVIKRIKNKKIVCVGDIVFLSMLEKNLYPNLAIIDLKTKRYKKINIDENILKKFKILRAKNPRSTITRDLYEKIREGLRYDRCLIIVDGEEDLAVIPCILLCDESHVILYGQPDEGIVLVEINEETLERISAILLSSKLI